MKKILLTVITLLAALAVAVMILLASLNRIEEPPAQRLFINGNVLTMDADNPVAEAIAIRDNRIEAVGDNATILALADSGVEATDLQGKTLLPGFIDSHGHFPGSGTNAMSVDLNSPPLGKIETIAELQAALKAQLDNPGPHGIVSGMGYDDTLLAEKRHPTRAELDAVSSEQPIVASHISGHMMVANSAALALAGIDASTPDPKGGVIGRRPGSNEPNGLLEETARLGVLELQYDMSLFDIYQMVTIAVDQYLANGVTTAQSGGIPLMLLEGNALFSRLGLVPMRLNMMPFEHDIHEQLASGDYDAGEYETDRVNIIGIKLIADGSIQGYTGYLSQPYHVPYHGDTNYRGYAAIPRDDLFEKVQRLHSAGYRLAIHGNGDAAIDDILDAFEAAQAAHPVDDPRMVLVHAQMAREDQVARMQALGITPTFFSAHTYYWGDRHRDIFIGPERAAVISPAKWAQDYGVRFSSHMDTPVTPMLPLQAVWSMVNRQTYAGNILGPEQRIDVMSALRAVTIDAAWQVFQDNELGSLEAGKLADMVILSTNPLDDPAGLRDIQVEETIIGGATVFKR